MSILKNLKNFVTGGAAKVDLAYAEEVLRDGESLSVMVTVKPLDQTLIFEKVYLNVKAVERSAHDTTIYAEEKVLAEHVQVSAGEEKTWSMEIKLPESAPATYIGKHSSLHWSAQAGVELPGVNPTSDQRSFIVNKKMIYPATR
ncbi:MAG: sporulation protein [Marinoscillum sp.]|uniref:sporulation protein n=1 Tax=Marinoscillum sp. TaxID=2024838 RepID=UPI003304853F